LKQQQEAEATLDDHQFVAQPIATGDSTFNNLATKLEPVDSDRGGFDIGVDNPVNDEPGLGDLDFNAAFAKAEQLIEATEFRSALELLSRFYRNDDLTGPQRQRLLPTLDALAGKVIYSDEHHLVPQPYVVGANESLVDIAGKWHVPAQLIYNVHQKALANPITDIQPGTQLKMIPGPFQAEVDLQSKVLTMFLGDLYAGRFPIRVGISGAPRPGEYQVVLKSKNGHIWRDSNGVDYPPGSSENGYGPNWIGLTGSLCIHEVADDAGDGHHGCIGLSAKDAKDVFAILAEKSEMTIVR
jgi:lipoprotein-anchoring transpeptidase ErfK/SrfK